MARANCDETGPTVDDHLADVEDGCGCVGIWTHMSEHRDD